MSTNCWLNDCKSAKIAVWFFDYTNIFKNTSCNDEVLDLPYKTEMRHKGIMNHGS